MPDYKLVCFNVRGKAELTRWLFAYANIPYVDERIVIDDWPKHKSKYHTGKVPVLLVDDTQLPESIAIARYTAKLAGLLPEDDLEAALCDAVVISSFEIMEKVYLNFTSTKSEEEKKKGCLEITSSYMARFNKHYETREWFISDKMTWADLKIALIVGWVQERSPESVEEFSSLISLKNKIRALPAIKSWIEKRPVTDY